MEGESSLSSCFGCNSTDVSLVGPAPTASHGVPPVMAPIKPATWAKKAAAKAKVVSRPVTRPRAWKVTRIVSQSLEVPALPLPGPSRGAPPPLFEEPARLGDEDIGMGAPVKNGFSDLTNSQIGQD